MLESPSSGSRRRPKTLEHSAALIPLARSVILPKIDNLRLVRLRSADCAKLAYNKDENAIDTFMKTFLIPFPGGAANVMSIASATLLVSGYRCELSQKQSRLR